MEDKTLASIANKFAADLYGAKVYAESIEDHFGNQTSFALIARTACRKCFRDGPQDLHPAFLTTR